jgi:hypothetical protein
MFDSFTWLPLVYTNRNLKLTFIFLTVFTRLLLVYANLKPRHQFKLFLEKFLPGFLFDCTEAEVFQRKTRQSRLEKLLPRPEAKGDHDDRRCSDRSESTGCRPSWKNNKNSQFITDPDYET